MENTITDKDIQNVRDRLSLTPESKILNISHKSCMDGTGCVQADVQTK